MGKNKKSTNISPGWTIANIFIQAIIGGGIIAAFVLTLINIKQQREFHVDTLRPWVSCMPRESIVIEADGFRNIIEYKNFGKSPAIKVAIRSVFYFKDSLKPNAVFCSDTSSLVFSTFFPEMVEQSRPFNKIEEYYGAYTQEKIIELIKKGKIYFYSSVSYYNITGKSYYYSIITSPIFGEIITENEILVGWAVLNTSQKRCIKLPKN